jgi:hypothetical protein
MKSHQIQPKTIAIIGAGVSGLTIAHKLCKHPQYKITVYEKNSEIGGLARSIRTNDGCATEYSWRVFFGFYKNIFRIMNDIQISHGKTVLNNLTTYKHLNVSDAHLSWYDKLFLLYNVLYGMTCCDSRLSNLDDLSWWKSLESISSSNVFREIGPWLGMDRYNGSYNSVIRVGMEMQIFNSIINNSYYDYVTTLPTNEAWFDPWELYLTNNNVPIHKNTELIDVNIKNNHINYVTLYNSSSKEYNNIIADYYVFALPVNVLSEIIYKVPSLNHGTLSNIQNLTKISLHIQLSFQLYFNKPISIGDYNAFLLVDSPWDLIILIYDKIYDAKICNDVRIKGAWSITACTAYIPGIIFNKSMQECSYDEIICEIWSQLMNSKKLKDIILAHNGFELSQNLIDHWSPLWPSFKYSNVLHTSEPKFTNNVGTLKLRPTNKTHIDNLFIAGAHTQDTLDIFSMEAACISGINVANLINSNIDPPCINNRPLLFAPFRLIDEILYDLRLPNINVYLIILLFGIIVKLMYNMF